ncbi:glycosyltransferase family 39 protein [Patescibacteria group bacterium]
MKLFFKKNKKIIIIVACIIAVAIFLRFYGIADFFPFANDEGRDMFIAESIVNGEVYPSLGAPASTGDFFLGPFYYYFMAFALLFWKHPAAPALLNAIFSVLTVPLLYLAGRALYSRAAGVVAAALFATSFIAVWFARWSWNPNLLPFIMAAVVFCLAKLSKKNAHGIYLVALFAALAIAIQLHATAFLLIPAIIIFWAIWRPKISHWYYWPISLGAAIAVYLPWLLYELTHNFSNVRGAMDVLSGGESNFAWDRFGYIFEKISGEADKALFGGLINEKTEWIIGIIIVAIAGLFVWRLIVRRHELNKANWFLIIISAFGIAFYALFSGKLFPHYFIFLLPILILGTSVVLGELWRFRKYGKIIVIVLVLGLSITGIYATMTRYQSLADGTASGEHGVAFRDQQAVVDVIVSEGEQEIKLIDQAKNHYDKAYKYLLKMQGVEVNEDATVQATILRTSETKEIPVGAECFPTLCVIITK